MKKTLLLSATLLFFQTLALAQGIMWEPTIETAFAKAKAQNKPVFVECYHPSCPICMKLEPTLKDNEVGRFYNQNFINFKLNLSDARQVKFLNDKKIYLLSYPLFLFFDNNQNIIYLNDPINTPGSLIQHGKTALDPERQTANAWKKYQAGTRDVNSMIDLSYQYRLTRDTTRNLRIANDLYAVYPKDKLGSKESWAIAKKCVMDMDNGFAEFWMKNLGTARKYEGEDGHAGNETNAMALLIQMAIYSPKASKYSMAKVNKIKQYMTLVGAGQYITSNTWHIEAQAMIREQGQDKAFTFIQNQVSQTKQPQMLVYYVTFYNNNFPDGKYASQVRNWLNIAQPQLSSAQDLTNYRYESARLYKKAGDKAKAKQEIAQAKTTLGNARANAKDANSRNVVESLSKNIDKLAAEVN
ncbi:thioredoxin family protein [Emticicia sp. TH156]|uniref:thioredoxin family protein n=1 Tax=Emticicia sp. TH156 TaxID=2067454 RepID=UPI000C78471D|nr:thioredoxin family protein [Emticicia sp. TH156]PLK46329.1 hypothetical protein C0V77_03015 [Emticicia sp. TH156]